MSKKSLRTASELITADVLISKPTCSINGSRPVVSSKMKIHDNEFQINYKVSSGPVSLSSDAFLTASLYPAMLTGGDLTIDGSVSAKLLGSTDTIQDIVKSWFPEYKSISIHAARSNHDGASEQRRVGAFFSGGIDSYYTFLRHQDEISTLIFIHGFDIQLDRHAFRHRMSQSVREVASSFGKELIEVETNLPEILEKISSRFIPVGGDAFGTVLASIAHLLSPRLEKVYISSGYPYSELHPWGSHLLLDPLWSSEDVKIVHDGCEATRVMKAELVAESEIALDNLRVCFFKPEKGINCERCEKCLRSMAILRAVGALDRCKSFRKKLDLEALAMMKIPHEVRYRTYQTIFQAVKMQGNDPELAKALHECLKNYKYSELAKELNDTMVPFLESSEGKELLDNRRNTFFKNLWQSSPAWMTAEVLKENLKLVDQKCFGGLFDRIRNEYR
jgi:hypothetical protein